MTSEQADRLIEAINQLSFVASVIALCLAMGLAAVTIAIHRRRDHVTPPAAPPPASGNNRSDR